MAEKKRIVVCVSSYGRDLQAIIDGCAPDGRIENAEVVAVISSTPGVGTLRRAEKHQIPAVIINPRNYAEREQFDKELTHIIMTHWPDLIVLAEFWVRVPTMLLENFPGKVINIHPSLIPAFCGKGMYGIKVHEAVLAKRVGVTGATVHFVDADFNTGPIIAQMPVVVRHERPETLQDRVMECAEFEILPWAINHIVNERIKLIDGQVWYSRFVALNDGVSGWARNIKYHQLSEN